MTKLRTHRLFSLVSSHSRDGGSLEKLSLQATICIVVFFCAAAAIASPAQTTFFTSLLSFNGTNGTAPLAGLVQARDGNFYGTTLVGGGTACNGGYGCGTVFRVSPGGTLTTLYSFQGYPYGPDGAFPYARLVQGSDGNLYGTTYMGGATNWGTVFKITTSGTLTTLYSFCTQPNCSDGIYPRTPLVQATDGNFYGTNDAGGGGNCYGGCGTVFKITPSGALTTLYSFCPQNGCLDGSSPLTGLVQAADGNFYGANQGGGAYLKGTIFRITPQGKLTTLYTFCAQFGCPDGDEAGALMQGSDGDFYGSALQGGNTGIPFCRYGCGTIFKITAAGTLTTLYRFHRTDGLPLSECWFRAATAISMVAPWVAEPTVHQTAVARSSRSLQEAR